MAAPLSERNLTLLGIAGSLITAIIGLLAFYGRYEFAEGGTELLVVLFLIGSIVLFFAIRLWSIPLIIIAIGAVVGVQIYAAKKFDWRETYITQAQLGQPFFLEEFIDHYPSYEEHTFSFLKAPDWVGFNDDCVQPALLNQPVAPRCGNFDLITRYYNIDVAAAMSNHLGKMQKTAKMVSEGKMTKRSDYAACIANKACATIPLLPKGVDAAKLDPTSRDYIGVRQAFWSLVNDKRMSQEACALTPLCKALVVMKAVDSSRLPF